MAKRGTAALSCLGLLGAAAVVFVVCSIVQGIGGSDMFSTSFADPHSALLEFAMQVTFWPGWVITVVLVLAALVNLFKPDDAADK